MVDMLRALPVFVVKGLPGAYYSETQLKYVTGTNAHPLKLYQMLRDGANRRQREGEVEAEEEGLECDVGAEELEWRPQGDRDEESEFEVAEEVEGEGVSNDKLMRAIGYEVPGAGMQGGVEAERALAASAGGALAATFKVGLGDLCAANRTPDAFAKIVVRTAVAQGLGIHGAMRRAVWQYQAVGRDHVALRREFLNVLANVIQAAPELPGPSSNLGAAATGAREEGAEQDIEGESGSERTCSDSERTETDVESEREESAESREEGAESDSSEEGSVDLEKEEEEELGGSSFYEKPGRETSGKAPIRGLGDMGRGFWEDFRIPEEAVMMASRYDAEIAENFKAKHNLWLLSVLSRIFPTTIPFPTPDHEVLFSENLVRRALPEAFHEPGRNMMVEALYVSEGLPVEKTGYASTGQLLRMLQKLRGPEWEGAGGESGSEEGGMRALKRARAEFREDTGTIAEHEALIEEVRSKRGKNY